MTTFRQRRRLPVPVRNAVWQLAAALFSLGSFLAAPAAASPHTHDRRPLPTPLRATAVLATHPAPRKAVPKRHSRPAGVPSVSQSPKRGKGHSHPPTPVNDPVPFLRARRRPPTRGYQEARAIRPGPRRPFTALFGARAAPVRSSRTAVGGARGYTVPHASSRAAQPLSRMALDAPLEAVPLAEGVPYPEEIAPPTRIGPAMATAASPAYVSAPPAATRLAKQGNVVQGFGPEMAVLPSTTVDRYPPATIPITAAPPTSAEPLDEREAVTEAAVSPLALPALYDRDGRLVVPPPLKGSHDVLLHQNAMATFDGLERIQDDRDLERLRAARLLVTFPVADSLRVNDDLPANRRLARPWTVQFAADLASAFYARFREPVTVTSAVRTVQYQARLQRINGNAAATAGDAASPHLTGQAVDFAKRGMSLAELAWMRGYLQPLMQTGKIDVEEEFRQACFHVSVYRSYGGERAGGRTLQQAHIVLPATNTLPSSQAQP